MKSDPRRAGVDDDGTNGGFEEEVVEGQLAEFSREDLNLASHIEFAVEDEPAFPLDDAETAGTTVEVGSSDVDVEPFGKALEFLEELLVGQKAVVRVQGSGKAAGAHSNDSTQYPISIQLSEMIEAILFDNDGVLVDTEPVYIQACIDAAATVGHTVTADDYVRLTMTQGQSIYHELGLDGEALDELREKRDTGYGELLAEQDLVLPGVREAIPLLANRLRLAVVTSSRKPFFDQIHRHSSFLTHFEFVLTREDFEKSKPDPEPYLRGLQRLGLEGTSCLAVEDSPRGVASAVDAGMRCVAVPTELTQSGDFGRAYRVVETIDDVIGVVDEMVG